MLLACLLSPCASGAAVDVVTVDARVASQAPGPSSYRGGTSVSPTGRTIGMNSMYLTLDGAPWLPVAGEFHFSRVPESEWEDEILKMKAAGVDIVSTYIIWIHHEETEGQFDWSGRKDLRHFVELCARHGLYVIARVGPWAHGEARNGGFPDWLLQKGPTRRNDPVYMLYVAAYYAQIAQQLKGLLWKDGGPVIGIQLENEYSGRGPGQGEEHILALKKLAVQDGLDVPLYTLTGWDNAAVPAGEVLPVFGGYPDAPWDASLTDLAPNEVYMLRFGKPDFRQHGHDRPEVLIDHCRDGSTGYSLHHSRVGRRGSGHLSSQACDRARRHCRDGARDAWLRSKPVWHLHVPGRRKS